MQDQDDIVVAAESAAPRPKATSGKGAPPERDDVLHALTPATGKGAKKPSRTSTKGDTTEKKRVKERPAQSAARGRTKNLRLHVTADVRKAFKKAAAANGCKKDELFARIFADWTARHPS